MSETTVDLKNHPRLIPSDPHGQKLVVRGELLLEH
jgi:hypothetical protein